MIAASPRALAAAFLVLACVASPRGGVGQGAAAPCAGSDAHACFLRGLRLVDSALRASTADRTDALRAGPAARVLDGACTLHEAEACATLGQLFAFDAVSLATSDADTVLARAAALFRRACRTEARPSGAACSSLGDAYAYRLGVPVDADSALALFDRGCHLGNATACARFGMLLKERGELGPGRLRVAREHLGQACERGSAFGCGRSASETDRLLRERAEAAPGTPETRREAQTILGRWRRSCGLRDWSSCDDLGTAFTDTRYVPRPRPDSALHYFRVACAGNPDAMPHVIDGDTLWMGSGDACVHIGRALLRPDSAALARADTGTAVEFFRIGCQLFTAEACAMQAEYGYRLFRADSARPHALRPYVALLYAGMACEEVGGKACATAGWLLEQPHLRDPVRAASYHARACSLAVGGSCYRAGRLRQQTSGQLAAGLKFFRLGCAHADGDACEALAALLEGPSFRLPELTLPLHERACAYLNVDGCWHAQAAYRERKDEEREGRYRAQACRLNVTYCKRDPTNLKPLDP